MSPTKPQVDLGDPSKLKQELKRLPPAWLGKRPEEGISAGAQLSRQASRVSEKMHVVLHAQRTRLPLLG